jgi:hypothetical protein
VQPTTPAKQHKIFTAPKVRTVALSAISMLVLSLTSTSMVATFAFGYSFFSSSSATSECSKLMSHSANPCRPWSRSAFAHSRASVPAPPVTANAISVYHRQARSTESREGYRQDAVLTY